MSPHDEMHELELERMLTQDELDPLALANRAGECAACAERIDEFMATASDIEAAMDEDLSAVYAARDEILAAVRFAPPGSRDDVIEAGIRAGFLPESARRPRRGFLMPAAALSAAALALVAFWLARSNPPKSVAAPPIMLSSTSQGVHCDAPVGAVTAFDTFKWTAQLGTQQTYSLIVRSTDRVGADGAAIEIRKVDLSESTATLTAAERDTLGSAIEWEVRIHDDFGSSTTSFGRAYATLRER